MNRWTVRREHRDKRPREKCYICGVWGLLGEEVVPTATAKWIHHGDCHDELIRKADSSSLGHEEPALFDPQEGG